MDPLTNVSNLQNFSAPNTTLPEIQKVEFFWTWQEILLAIPLGLIVITTIIGNFLILYSAFSRPHKLRQPTHILIANLAMADFLVGVFVMPFLAVGQVSGMWVFGWYCDWWTVIHFCLCSASTLSTCAICIERYIGVRFPLSHKSIMNTKRIFGLILIVWALAVFKPLCSVYIWPQPKSGLPYVCDPNLQLGYVLMSVIGLLYVPACVMVTLYGNIYLIAKRHLKVMRKHSAVSMPTLSSYSFGIGKGSPKRWGSFLKSNSIKPTADKQENTNSMEPDPRNMTSELSVSSSSRRGSETENLEEKKDKGDFSSKLVSPQISFFKSTNRPIPEGGTSAQRKKQIDLAKRLSLLVGVVLVSYLPYFTLYLVKVFNPDLVNIQVFNAFAWVRYFNSCLNPVIYAWAVPAYRKAITEIVFTGFGPCQRSSDNGIESKGNSRQMNK